MVFETLRIGFAARPACMAISGWLGCLAAAWHSRFFCCPTSMRGNKDLAPALLPGCGTTGLYLDQRSFIHAQQI